MRGCGGLGATMKAVQNLTSINCCVSCSVIRIRTDEVVQLIRTTRFNYFILSGFYLLFPPACSHGISNSRGRWRYSIITVGGMMMAQCVLDLS